MIKQNMVLFVLLSVSVAACQSGSTQGPQKEPDPKPAATGPQAPPDEDVIDALRPCMRVGRVFARLPASDRVEEVMEACAALLRPKCKARFQEAQSLEGVLGSCAADYCPDLTPTPALCDTLALGKKPKTAEIVALFEAALRHDYPDQHKGLDILSGMVVSALLEMLPPAQ